MTYERVWGIKSGQRETRIKKQRHSKFFSTQCGRLLVDDKVALCDRSPRWHAVSVRQRILKMQLEFLFWDHKCFQIGPAGTGKQCASRDPRARSRTVLGQGCEAAELLARYDRSKAVESDGPHACWTVPMGWRPVLLPDKMTFIEFWQLQKQWQDVMFSC